MDFEVEDDDVDIAARMMDFGVQDDDVDIENEMMDMSIAHGGGVLEEEDAVSALLPLAG